MPRKALDPERRRRQLLDAAEALFLADGFDATSVAAIVTRVGVAQGTFYYHFPSKEAAGEAVIDRWIGGIRETLRPAMEGDDDAPAQLRRVLAALHAAMDAHRRVIAGLLEPANEGLHGRFAHRLGADLLALFEEIVARGLAAGDLAVEHPRETLQLLLAALSRLTRAHHPSADDASLARLYAATESLFLRGLGAPVPSPNL